MSFLRSWGCLRRGPPTPSATWKIARRCLFRAFEDTPPPEKPPAMDPTRRGPKFPRLSGSGGPDSSGGGGCDLGSALAPLSGGCHAGRGVSDLAGGIWTALGGVAARMDLPPIVEVFGCFFAGVAAVDRL